jgi:ATPase subunit of ABC transporter with duplicated ATPase domains
MSRTFKTWRDPYDEGFSTCRKKEIEIKPGVTVLVGCNGAGKSTLLHNIREKLKKEDIPTFIYDNEKDGGHNSIGESMFYGDVALGATALCSSEGENITINLGKIASKLRKFIQTGDNGDRFNRLGRLLAGEDENEVTSNERWILLDAMDSGYSIDNVIEMKDFFQMVLDDAKMYGSVYCNLI